MMGIIGGPIGYALLRSIAPRRGPDSPDIGEGQRDEDVNLIRLFGKTFFQEVEGKTVIDFGCGSGGQTVEIARMGAAKVIGIDIQERYLEQGKERARKFAVADRCVFAKSTSEPADIVISADAFEHFADPAEVLRAMAALLKPEGYVLASFGPTWRHPYGGHLFSVFPWSHLLFTEASQIRWRSDFKTDGASKFSEVEGGLNQLTISRFERFVADSPFRFEWLETIPIKGIGLFKTKALREMGSSFVRCKLRLK